MPEDKPTPKFLTYEQWKASFSSEDIECPKCKGASAVEKMCPDCEGEGVVEIECEECGGSGRRKGFCRECDSKGTINGKELIHYQRQYNNDKLKWELWHKALQEVANAQQN